MRINLGQKIFNFNLIELNSVYLYTDNSLRQTTLGQARLVSPSQEIRITYSDSGLS